MSLGHRRRRPRPLSNAKECVQIIESAWCRHRDRQMFRLLKHAVCAAEHALSNDILRRLSPREAELLRDPSLNVKVKFRFGGIEFPPVIYFKVFVRNFNGAHPKYVNAKTMINSDVKARTAACQQMGHRVFYQQMLADSLHGVDGRAADELDVVTLKDYMQYSSLLDELPSYLGGRANNWRRLNLEDIPRHSLFYDIVSYIESGNISTDLRQRLPTLLISPNAPSVQLQHVELLKQMKSMDMTRTSPSSLSFIKTLANNKPIATSRRSRRALQNASKMRQAYILTRSESLPTTLILQYEQQEGEKTAGTTTGNTTTDEIEGEEPRRRADNTPMTRDEFNDGEVDALYAWTEQLEWNDDLFKTERLSTA